MDLTLPLKGTPTGVQNHKLFGKFVLNCTINAPRFNHSFTEDAYLQHQPIGKSF